MSQNKQSSAGFIRGLVVGVVIAITAITVFNQITSSVSMRPMAADSIVSLKEAAWFSANFNSSSAENGMASPVRSNLPPVLVRKPMNEEKNIIQPKLSVDDLPKAAKVIPKPDKPAWSPPAVKSAVQNEIIVKPEKPPEVSAALITLEDGKHKMSFSPLSRSECMNKYGNRRYYKETEQRLPPMLYTFPGSGNTWCRLLIEYSSGIYSGAVYNDASLLEPLPGEFKCNHAVSVVKVHPHTHDFESLRTGTFHSDNDKCKKGNVRQFKRAILLIRNPFDSIWSEFQRRVSKSHVSGINRIGFDWHRWQANACSLSHMYFQMWNAHHAGIEKHFSKDNYLYIKYEDLKDKKGANVVAMKKVTDFLGVPATEEKLSCAFVLAENPDAHRTIDKTTMMTKEDAYTKELTCRMWALFGEFASKHGYKPYNNFDCSVDNSTGEPYPKIRNVNVGAQGEYDHKWVTPGQKLIDFGGYNRSAYLPPEGQKGQLHQGGGGRAGGAGRKRKAKPSAGGGVNGQSAGGGRKGGGMRAKNGPNAFANAASTVAASADGGESSGGIGQVGLNKPAWQ